MGAALLGNSHIVDAQSGRWINAKHQRLAELIHDYDPTLFLAFFDPDNLHEDQGDVKVKPYALVQINPDLPEPYYVFYLDEDEIAKPVKVMAMLFEAQRRANGAPGDLAKWIEDAERARELVKFKDDMEEEEFRREQAEFLWKTPFHNLRTGGRDETGMFNRLYL